MARKRRPIKVTPGYKTPPFLGITRCVLYELWAPSMKTTTAVSTKIVMAQLLIAHSHQRGVYERKSLRSPFERVLQWVNDLRTFAISAAFAIPGRFAGGRRR